MPRQLWEREYERRVKRKNTQPDDDEETQETSLGDVAGGPASSDVQDSESDAMEEGTFSSGYRRSNSGSSEVSSRERQGKGISSAMQKELSELRVSEREGGGRGGGGSAQGERLSRFSRQPGSFSDTSHPAAAEPVSLDACKKLLGSSSEEDVRRGLLMAARIISGQGGTTGGQELCGIDEEVEERGVDDGDWVSRIVRLELVDACLRRFASLAAALGAPPAGGNRVGREEEGGGRAIAAGEVVDESYQIKNNGMKQV